MLVTLYLLKGIAALRSILILTAGASASWYSQYINSPTIGRGPLIMVVSCILSATLIPLPPDEPILPEFIQLSLWGIHVEDAVLPLRSRESEMSLSAAMSPSESDALPTAIDGSAVPNTSSVPMSAAPAVDVPELNWVIPEVPTIRGFKAKATQPDSVTYFGDLYTTRFEVYEHSLIWNNALRSAASEGDVVPPLWRYRFPLISFRKLCLSKGEYPYAGHFHFCLIWAMRASTLVVILWDTLLTLFPVPRHVLAACRSCRNALRRMIIARRQREFRRLHNRR
ncbi:uncharacterized protein C8Q71DRAFT_722248 [Rhodofomes roseus]|uniref:Uncharacterized protein n=1 Tax=Rhodofomes roseus TaxID=34475 RepID=A0ABQ8KN23_9APHY|nr:uncharacterized protein C8Q71DRAFT_722248 [Rhodofomes roseus]KAH9839270.1 hypothetical protein C8Q71DRAFT_722248 [Rhodofomes roseus]